MTYCLGILTNSGLIMAADSRTNAGVDYISTQQKLFDFSLPGDRVIVICTSGNLSITQETLSLVRRDIKTQAPEHLHNLPTMHEVVRYLGKKLRHVMTVDQEWLRKDGIEASCNFLVGGQILDDDEPELYLVYPQGNAIQASKETPFLQIGETKYGKPILDRILTMQTPVDEAAKCALVSIDSTMKSNISVGPPINLILYRSGKFKIEHQLSLRRNSPYLLKLRQEWEQEVKRAFDRVSPIEWDDLAAELGLANGLVEDLVD
jgi:putative proteasome-type protease